jgi:hypothetical protein
MTNYTKYRSRTPTAYTDPMCNDGTKLRVVGSTDFAGGPPLLRTVPVCCISPSHFQVYLIIRTCSILSFISMIVFCKVTRRNCVPGNYAKELNLPLSYYVEFFSALTVLLYSNWCLNSRLSIMADNLIVGTLHCR